MEAQLSFTTKGFLKSIGLSEVTVPDIDEITEWVKDNYKNYSHGQIKAVSEHIFKQLS